MPSPYLPIDQQHIDDDPCMKCDATVNKDGELEHTAVCPTLKDPDDYPEPD